MSTPCSRVRSPLLRTARTTTDTGPEARHHTRGMTEVSATIRMRLCMEDILRKRVPLFDGVQTLLKLAGEVPQLEADRDVRKLSELLGTVDHLAIGAAREHWEREALHRQDRELLELERQHADSVHYACRRLTQTLDTM